MFCIAVDHPSVCHLLYVLRTEKNRLTADALLLRPAKLPPPSSYIIIIIIKEYDLGGVESDDFKNTSHEIEKRKDVDGGTRTEKRHVRGERTELSRVDA